MTPAPSARAAVCKQALSNPSVPETPSLPGRRPVSPQPRGAPKLGGRSSAARLFKGAAPCRRLTAAALRRHPQSAPGKLLRTPLHRRQGCSLPQVRKLWARSSVREHYRWQHRQVLQASSRHTSSTQDGGLLVNRHPSEETDGARQRVASPLGLRDMLTRGPAHQPTSSAASPRQAHRRREAGYQAINLSRSSTRSEKDAPCAPRAGSW